jgi:hypothetical protein
MVAQVAFYNSARHAPIKAERLKPSKRMFLIEMNS